MTRQDQNEAFLLTSFLYGGNADYIDALYARYKSDPRSVEPSWAEFFSGLSDSVEDVKKNAEGPSWQRKDWPRPRNDELVSAFDGDWGEVAVKVQRRWPKGKGRRKAGFRRRRDAGDADSIHAIMMIAPTACADICTPISTRGP